MMKLIKLGGWCCQLADFVAVVLVVFVVVTVVVVVVVL